MTLGENSIQEAIVKAVKSIAGTGRDIPENCLRKDSWNVPLTGTPFYLTSVELVYLLFELEKNYDVRIQEGYLASYGFISVNVIAETIRAHLKK